MIVDDEVLLLLMLCVFRSDGLQVSSSPSSPRASSFRFFLFFLFFCVVDVCVWDLRLSERARTIIHHDVEIAC